MSWVRLDDGFPDHPKVAPLNDKAFRVHVRALCYCGRHLTDGKIPAAVVDEITRGRRAVVAELVEAGLWSENGGNAYLINDYLDYNPSRDHVEGVRRKRSEAGRSGAENKWRGGSK